jgi:hypothetical protein
MKLHLLKHLTIIAVISLMISPSIANEFLTTTKDKNREPLAKIAITNAAQKNVTSTTVFERSGVIKVIHGSACGQSNKSGKEEVIELDGKFDFPAYANEATVVLNGWRLKYLSKDHHVRGLSASIQKVAESGNRLTWRARGFLSDKNFDDGYTFCYYYTAMAWNDDAIKANAYHINSNDHNYYLFNKTKTALSVLSSYFYFPKFANIPIIHLPRGFSLFFANQSSAFPACFDCAVDHHILQLGFNTSSSERFIDPKKKYGFLPSPMLPTTERYVDMGYLSWDTYAIMKDNSLRRDYWFDEWFSVIAGVDAHIIQPPYAILPHEDSDGWGSSCIGEASGTKTKQITINNIPYDFAIPMLTGFEMKFGCDDEHVTEVGVWIDSMQYSKPAGQNGTLSYTVSTILRDKNSSPGHASSHNVHILGLNEAQSRPRGHG